jgi:deoxyribodipyrimidine photolyase-related protein
LGEPVQIRESWYYAASGAYMDRMSNYCSSCRFNVKQRTGPQAWDFIARNRDRTGGNPRMAQMVRTYDRFALAERQRISESAASLLAAL